MKILVIISAFLLISATLALIQPVDHLLTGQHQLTDLDLQTLFNYYRSEFVLKSRFSNLFNELTEEERHYREKIFNENIQKILSHNRNPNKSYTQGINLFTGLSRQEKKHFILGEAQNCSATAYETLKVKAIFHPEIRIL